MHESVGVCVACVIPPHGMCVSSFLPPLDGGHHTIICLYLYYLVRSSRTIRRWRIPRNVGSCVRACTVHLRKITKWLGAAPTRKEGVLSHGRCSWPLGKCRNVGVTATAHRQKTNAVVRFLVAKPTCLHCIWTEAEKVTSLVRFTDQARQGRFPNKALFSSI